MRILGVNNYQVQNQNRNQTRNSNPNFNGLVELRRDIQLPPQSIKGIMKDCLGKLAVFFDHPFSGEQYKAFLIQDCDPSQVAKHIAEAELPGKTSSIAVYIDRFSKVTLDDGKLYQID